MDAKTKKQAKDLADEIIKEVGPAIEIMWEQNRLEKK